MPFDKIIPDTNSTNKRWVEIAKGIEGQLEQARLEAVTAPNDAHPNDKTVQRTADEATQAQLREVWERKEAEHKAKKG